MKLAAPSLFARIILWFILNLIITAGILILFFSFEFGLDLDQFFRPQNRDRLEKARQFLADDLASTPREKWADLLIRHGTAHQVSFALIKGNGEVIASPDMEIPPEVLKKNSTERPKWHLDEENLRRGIPHDTVRADNKNIFHRLFSPSRHGHGRYGQRGQNTMGEPFFIKTIHPTHYWIGTPVPVPGRLEQPGKRQLATLLVSSGSITGNVFFFDFISWLLAGGAVMVVSTIIWFPLARHITVPLKRMTHVTESIANGDFDVRIPEKGSDEIGRLAKAINHMTRRLSGYVKGQKRFLGDVAHELGSPIARLQFGLGALTQRLEGSNQTRANEILEDVQLLSNLVSELLSFSKAEMHPGRIDSGPVHLLPVVQTLVQREVDKKAVVTIDIEPDLQAVADPNLLSRALANLIRNADQYAGDHGPVLICAHSMEKSVMLEIKDRGPGVPEHLIRQIFEPFYRPDFSRERAAGGVGLGLAIVKTCIDACKGTVSARNRKEGGFAVMVRLPLFIQPEA